MTAITFVALGTSLPDLFASKQAALEDKTADASIGNVTGSNSVNVFFGLGFPWLIATIAWLVRGPTDEWKRRYPEFVAAYPGGAYVVRGGDLGLSVGGERALFLAPLELAGSPARPRLICLRG